MKQPIRDLSHSFYLLGHRGARAEWLENSEKSFDYAHTLQVDGKKLNGVEFDVQMTADGEFVVVHDETLKRLVNLQSWIGDKSLTELTDGLSSNFLQSDWQRYSKSADSNFIQQKILPLTDLKPYLDGYAHIELEIKTHRKTNPQHLIKNLLRLLSQHHWHNFPITLTSFDTEIIYQLQNQQAMVTHHYPTGLLLEPTVTLASQVAFLPTPDKLGEQHIYQTFNLACELGCSQVGIYYALITPHLVSIAKRFGLQVTAWTVNDIDVAKKLVNMGVDCVITDYPTDFLTTI